MRARRSTVVVALTLAVGAAIWVGCESSNGGSYSTTVYYGTGFDDPWYYGGYHDDIDVVVTPPPRPERPIARPPVAGPRPTPLPSIPARPMPRRR